MKLTASKKHSYIYPRPALTVDIVIILYKEKQLSLFLVNRGLAPFLGEWALSGGFVKENEVIEAVGFDLMLKFFTLSNLQELHEILLNIKLDKRNFRKKVLSFDFLVNTQRKQVNTSYCAPNLYRVDQKKIRAYAKSRTFSFGADE